MNKILLLLLLSLTCFSQVKISYKKTDGLLDITPYISYLADSTQKLTFEQVRNLPASGFTANNKVGLNLGTTNKPIWLKVDFEHNLTQKDLYIYLDLLEANSITSFAIDNKNKVEILHAGVKRPFGNSYFKTNKNIFLVGHNPKQFYLRIESNGLYIPIFVSTIKPLVDYLFIYDTIHFLLFGLMIGLAFYNLLLFFSLKDSTFLYYFGFTIMSIINMLKVEGFQFVFFKSSWINDINIARAFTILFIYLFTTRFLNTKKLSPKFYKALTLLLVIILSFLPFEFFPPEPWQTDCHEFLALIFVIIVLLNAIYVWRIGFSPAKYFVMAWSFYITGIVVITLAALAILPLHNVWVYYSWKIGHTCEALVILAKHFSWLSP